MSSEQKSDMNKNNNITNLIKQGIWISSEMELKNGFQQWWNEYNTYLNAIYSCHHHRNPFKIHSISLLIHIHCSIIISDFRKRIPLDSIYHFSCQFDIRTCFSSYTHICSCPFHMHSNPSFLPLMLPRFGSNIWSDSQGD